MSYIPSRIFTSIETSTVLSRYAATRRTDTTRMYLQGVAATTAKDAIIRGTNMVLGCKLGRQLASKSARRQVEEGHNLPYICAGLRS